MPITPANIAALPKPGFLIGGEKITTAAAGGVHEHRYAGTGELTYKVPMAGPHEVDLAVKAAREGFKVWSKLPANQRRIHMLRLAALIRERTPELRKLITAENSVPYGNTGYFPVWVAELFE